MQQNKLVYLDGLKGFGCVCVFLTHFVFAFYYGMYTISRKPVICRTIGILFIGKFTAQSSL